MNMLAVVTAVLGLAGLGQGTDVVWGTANWPPAAVSPRVKNASSDCPFLKCWHGLDFKYDGASMFANFWPVCYVPDLNGVPILDQPWSASPSLLSSRRCSGGDCSRLCVQLTWSKGWELGGTPTREHICWPDTDLVLKETHACFTGWTAARDGRLLPFTADSFTPEAFLPSPPSPSLSRVDGCSGRRSGRRSRTPASATPTSATPPRASPPPTPSFGSSPSL